MAKKDGMWAQAAARLGIPVWGRILILVLAAIACSLGGSLWHGFNRLDHMDAAIRSLAADATQKTQELVKELLAQAVDGAKHDDKVIVKKALDVAPVLIRVAEEKKLPAPPAFFQQQISSLSDIEQNRPNEFKRESTSVRIALADYRSSLQPSYLIPTGAVKLDLGGLGFRGPFDFDIYKAPNGWFIWDNSRLPPETESRVPGSEINPSIPEVPGPLKMNVTRTVLIGASQTIDGAAWRDVIFSKVRIKYKGGPVILNRVLFLSCTFEFLPDSKRSSDVATYIALSKSDISITD